jgi:hypothetical protein
LAKHRKALQEDEEEAEDEIEEETDGIAPVIQAPLQVVTVEPESS